MAQKRALWDAKHQVYIEDFVTDIQKSDGTFLPVVGFFYATDASEGKSEKETLAAMTIAKKFNPAEMDNAVYFESAGTSAKYEGLGVATLLNILRVRYAQTHVKKDGYLPYIALHNNAYKHAKNPETSYGGLTTYGSAAWAQGFKFARVDNPRTNPNKKHYSDLPLIALDQLLKKPEDYGFGQDFIELRQEKPCDPGTAPQGAECVCTYNGGTVSNCPAGNICDIIQKTEDAACMEPELPALPF